MKTRLGRTIGPYEAARLHTAFVWDTIELAQNTGFACELHTDLPCDVWRSSGLPHKVQAVGTLGAKIEAALREALEAGHPTAVVLGTDSPTLPPGHLAALAESRADVIFGPAEDGGFYAIAARKTCRGMLNAVDWSCSQTLAQSIRVVEKRGFTTALGPKWFDVDEPGDLDRLRGDGVLPRHTRAALAFTASETLHPEAEPVTISDMLKPGDKAPPVRLATDTGEELDLATLKGKTVVLWFYPKADTPG